MQHVSFRWPPADVLSRLVRDAQENHPGAVERLVSALLPAFATFFGRRVGLDADDLAQRACIRITGALPRIDPQRADAYISTVARNLLRTAYHVAARNSVRVADTEVNMLPTPAESVEMRLEYEELVKAIHRACLEKLRPGLRDVAVGLLQGDTPAEIAAALRISPVTVRTRLMRVRAALRAELGPYLDRSSDGRRHSA
jgi:RNA polymerase sigma factor (sigma-70 family)